MILVVDDSPPVIEGPADLEYFVGTTGHVVEWLLSDAHPCNYTVLRDGEVLMHGHWNVSGETVSLAVDGLEMGTYVFTFVAFDVAGNHVAHTVSVTVL